MKPRTKTFLYLALSIFILGLAIGLYMYNKPQPDVADATPQFVMTAMDLNKEFIANDSIAGAKYMGHIIQVTGKVADVQADSTHGIILTLDDPMAGVRCSMDKVLVPIAEKDLFPRGTLAKVKGICAGFDPIFGVVINRCVVVKPKKEN